MKAKRIFSTILFFALSAAMAASAGAKVTLPSIISDNMVLQQQTEAALWGWSEPGRKVVVKTSWDHKKYTAVADSQSGKFSLTVTTPEAGGPYTIEFNDGEKLTVGNVLVGEVWFCSGQSNMEHYMKGFGGEPVEGAAELISVADPKRQLRICQVTKTSSLKEEESVEAKWWLNDSESVSLCSAVAYFFADRLEKALDIPVAVIVDCWGGSTIWTWMSEELLRKDFPWVDLRHLSGEREAGNEYQDPCMLYNGMVKPIVPYTFKGILWYQGCSDRGNPANYANMQTAYVQMMRDIFNVPEAPFYFVQIAPFWYWDETDTQSGYFLTDGQEATLDRIPHSGMVTTCDLGAYKSIHYPAKKPVGERLALLALTHDYGVKGINADPPRFDGFRIEEGKVLAHFTMCGGLNPINTPLSGFEIAGPDGVYHEAEAMVNPGCYDEVMVWSEEVPEPVNARYCYRNWCHGMLYNNSGIPACPFRTEK